MATRITAGISIFLFVAGALFQFWFPSLGATLMNLAILSGLAAVLFMLRGIQARIRKNERYILNLQKSAQVQRDGLQSVDKWLRTTVPALLEGNSSPMQQSTGAKKPVEQETNSAGSVGIGRSSTPDVANPFTEETLNSMLKPGRELTVAGIFNPSDIATSQQTLWIPGDVISSLERRRPDLLVLDELEISQSSKWSVSMTSVGTRLMKELLDALDWATKKRIPVLIMPGAVRPDVHSSTLRTDASVTLPLTAEQLDAAAGAPLTPVLQRLQQIALQREGEMA